MRIVVLALALAAATSVVHTQRTAPPDAKGTTLEALTWQQAEKLLSPETVVVLPIGAAAKEHGPHLPLRNDLTIAEYLASRVVNASHVVVAPALPYHFYPAFLEYPGSTTLALETSRLVIVDIVRSLARFGPRRFYALNTGISTLRALEPAAQALAEDGILLHYTNLETALGPAKAKVQEQEGGTHADEIETSMMLYIAPETVNMALAVKDYTAHAGWPLTRQRGGKGTYSPTGTWGDPTLATREKGRVLVEALVGGVLDDVERLRRAALPVARSAAPAAQTRPPAAGRGAGEAPERGCTEGDDRTIRQIGEAFTLHWTNKDAKSLGLLWTDGGDIFHPDGVVERTRTLIITNRVHLFNRREHRASRHPLQLTMVRCVDADVAVADGKWELRGVLDTSGKPLPDYKGQATLVVKRSGGAWRIDAYRYTIEPEAVKPPVFLTRPGWPGKGEEGNLGRRPPPGIPGDTAPAGRGGYSAPVAAAGRWQLKGRLERESR
jgi:creatinine amidohydrolase